MEVLRLLTVVLLSFSCCPLLLLTPSAHVDAVPSIYPAEDQYVALNSLVNITFDCSAPIGSIAGWEINGSQIIGDDYLQRISRTGVVIHSESQYSQVIVTHMARLRPEYKVLSMKCLSTHNQTLGTMKTKDYSVITFGPPGMLSFLRLNLSRDELKLEWDRPQNMPPRVNVTYMVVINGSDIEDSISNTTIFESLPLGFLKDDKKHCEVFKFTVQAVNDAGSGPVSKPIVDTVPISPNVTNINNQLTVEKVDLQPLTVTIAFPSAEVCMNVTLQNYTVKIDEVATNMSASDMMLSPDGNIRLELTEEILSAGITLGGSFNLTITACTDIACRMSNPVMLNTTSVQRVEAVFFENHLYLRCLFADNSKADACIFRLTPIGGNETETFVVSRNIGYNCSRTKNYLEAYSHITVSDLYMTQIEGNLSLQVDPVEKDTEEEYVSLTKCEVSGPRPASIVGAIVGGVVGVFVAVTSVVVVVINICIFLWIRRNRNSVEQGRHYKVNGLVNENQPSTVKDEGRVDSDSGGSGKLTEYIEINDQIISIKLKKILRYFNETDYSKLKLKFDYSL